MSAATGWRPFGVPDEMFSDGATVDGAKASKNGTRVVNLRMSKWRSSDPAARWLRCAMLALGVLAAAAAVVSFAAQFEMVYRAKHTAQIAALEAGIPDAAALIFAALGIALALHGKRAIRTRLLNLGAVATSITMNLLAAGSGWRDLAIWVMPPVAYALASDTAIGVIRAHTLAAHGGGQGDEDSTPLAVVGGVLLWLLRLTLAMPSTLRGFRDWVVEECPTSPQPRALSLAREAATEAEAIAHQASAGERQAIEAAERFAADAEDARGGWKRQSAVCDDLSDELAKIRAEGGELRRAVAEAAERADVLTRERDTARGQADALTRALREVHQTAEQNTSLAQADAAAARAEAEAAAGRERDYWTARLERLSQTHADELAEARRSARGGGSWRAPGEGTKTARLLELVQERRGALAEVPLDQTARIAADIAPEIGLDVGSARRELRNAVLAAQAGRTS